MAERYQVLTRKNEQIRIEGCPVSIEAYAVLFDNETQQKLLQVKLQNNAEFTVNSCTISISADEEEIIPKHTFEGLAAKTGETFGSKSPVPLPDYAPDDVIPSVISVLFENGTEWKMPEEELPDLESDDELPDIDQPDEPDQALPSADESDQVLPELDESISLPLQEETAAASPEPAKPKKKTPLIIAIAGIVVVGLVLYFLFGWKSKAVRNVQNLISSIDATVTYDSKKGIEEAEKAYNELTDKEKKRVSNYDELVTKRGLFNIVAQKYYDGMKQTYAEELYAIHEACYEVWYSIMLVGVNVGSDYAQTAIECIRMFKDNKPYSSYGSGMDDYLWFAAMALCPDNVSGYSVRSGKESAVISECVSFNQNVTKMEEIKTLLPAIKSFCKDFSDQYPTDTDILGQWADTLSDTVTYLKEPSGTVSAMLDAATSFMDLAKTMKSYFNLK